MGRTLITGGAGYIGIELVDELLQAGREVTVLDRLLHGQTDRAEELRERGVTVVEGDIRDPVARGHALHGAEAVVHLAAIVGDPACARDPQLAQEVNVDASLRARRRGRGGRRRALRDGLDVLELRAHGRPDDADRRDRRARARVASTRSRRSRSSSTCSAWTRRRSQVTCLRFATVYGVAPRMRFDLTVNEFTRDLWADRELEVFGEQFWRPYVHVRDAARGIARRARGARASRWPARCSTSATRARTTASWTSWSEIRKQTDKGNVSYVQRTEDPRDYKVAFEKVHATLGYEITRTVPEGIAELLRALDEGLRRAPRGHPTTRPPARPGRWVPRAARAGAGRTRCRRAASAGWRPRP